MDKVFGRWVQNKSRRSRVQMFHELGNIIWVQTHVKSNLGKKLQEAFATAAMIVVTQTGQATASSNECSQWSEAQVFAADNLTRAFLDRGSNPTPSPLVAGLNPRRAVLNIFERRQHCVVVLLVVVFFMMFQSAQRHCRIVSFMQRWSYQACFLDSYYIMLNCM